MWGYGMDRAGPGQGQVAVASCECGNEHSGSIKWGGKGEFLDQLRNCQLLSNVVCLFVIRGHKIRCAAINERKQWAAQQPELLLEQLLPVRLIQRRRRQGEYSLNDVRHVAATVHGLSTLTLCSDLSAISSEQRTFGQGCTASETCKCPPSCIQHRGEESENGNCIPTSGVWTVQCVLHRRGTSYP